MENQVLEINASIQIQKRASEVFEAIVDPLKMSNYFISKGSGRMEAGRKLIWNFPEFEIDVPVEVVQIKENQFVSYTWDGENGEILLVEMMLQEQEDHSTVVRIAEKSMPNTEAGIKWLKGNTEGWANFLACLKAYLEFGINLRKGAFDFRFE